jgi:hypothetical protein
VCEVAPGDQLSRVDRGLKGKLDSRDIMFGGTDVDVEIELDVLCIYPASGDIRVYANSVVA